MKIIKFINTIIPAFFAVLLVVTLIIPALKNIDNPNFWVDESGQFWIAKGLNHFSEPLSKTSGITSVIHENARYNLDPGGFSLLLHFWSALGTNPTWLRLLPYLFFIISSIAIGYSAWLWTKSSIIALVAAQTILYSASIVHFGFELRAYSMEACGVAILTLLLTVLSNRWTKLLYVISGLLLAFFLTSRYSFSAFAFAFMTVFMLQLINNKSFNFSNILILSAPVFLSGLLIFFFTLNHQSPFLTPPPYVNDILFKGNNSQVMLSIINDNLFSRKALAKTLFYIIMSILLIRYRNSRSRFLPYFHIFLFMIVAEFVLIIFSIKGMYPWSFSSRFGISLQMISTIALVASACIVYNLLENKVSEKRSFYVLFIAVMTCISLLWVYKSTQRKFYPRDTLYDLLTAIPADQLEKGYFLATEKTAPTIRYLFEYGPMKNNPAYPSHFIIDSPGVISGDYPIHLSETSIQYILFSNWLQPTIDAYLRRCDTPFKRYSRGEVTQIYIRHCHSKK